MDGMEENRSGQTEDEPEIKGQLLFFPFLEGIEEELNPKKRSKNAHAETDEKEQNAFRKERA